ncbi:MAG: BadF/BadG/BcrA/BcrD ATPase family protein [Pyrinomonadaceae bacterium]
MRKNKSIKFSSHDLYLGVDGGGTKTHAVLLNSKKEIVSEGFSGPSNPLRVGIETAVSNIQSAVISACDAAGKNQSDIVCASIGLAGVRRSDLREQIRQRVNQRLGFKSVTVVTDAEIALYGTTLGKAGLVIISGTGSICLGKDGKGNTATAGGWGPTAGDEGGGVTIAKQALQAIAKALDGRGRATKLNEVAAEYFRASTPEDLIVAIYSPQMDNRKIAGFARYVIETAKENDEIAVEIIAIAGHELGLAASAVIKKLKMQRRSVPIGTVGSIFKAGELLTTPLIDTVHICAPKAYLVEPELPPANAAAIMSFNEYCK